MCLLPLGPDPEGAEVPALQGEALRHEGQGRPEGGQAQDAGLRALVDAEVGHQEKIARLNANEEALLRAVGAIQKLTKR